MISKTSKSADKKSFQVFEAQSMFHLFAAFQPLSDTSLDSSLLPRDDVCLNIWRLNLHAM